MLDESVGIAYTSKTGKRYRMREARPEELDEVCAIWQSGMEQHGYAIDPAKKKRYFAYLGGLIRSQDEVFKLWVAESESGEIAGWQGLTPYGNNPFARELGGESSTYVRASSQAEGVAQILLSHVIAHARTTSLHHVIAFVAEDNQAIDQIGKKLGGWQRCGLIPPSPKPPRRPGMVVFVNVLD